MMMQASPWFVRTNAPGQRLRLYCFSYAGGGAAAYAPWQAEIDPAIEVCAVQLPGRGARFGEAPWRSMPDLVETIGTLIGRQDDLPFAFFGHSLGALLGFEVARYCQRQGHAMPTQLFMSACNAPQMRSAPRNLYLLADAALIDSLRQYNGTPPEVLANRELMTLLLPMLRADFSLAEDYKYQAGQLLSIPISVLAGRSDDRTSAEQVSAWQRETSHACEVHWYDGDHFFLNSQRAQLLAHIGASMCQLQGA